jgi:hypothetical protein
VRSVLVIGDEPATVPTVRDLLCHMRSPHGRDFSRMRAHVRERGRLMGNDGSPRTASTIRSARFGVPTFVLASIARSVLRRCSEGSDHRFPRSADR